MGKRNFRYYLIYPLLSLSLIFVGLFSCPQNAQAANSDIVINEVMVNPATHGDLCTNDKCEWFELYNKGSESIDLKGWTVDGVIVTSSVLILPEDYLVITKNKAAFLSIWPIENNKVLEIAIGPLANGIDSLTIEGIGSLETFSWDDDPGDDISWERIDPSGSEWAESILGGTPGAKNSAVAPPDPPSYPDDVLNLVDLDKASVYPTVVTKIIDGDTIVVSNVSGLPSTTIRLLYIDTPESGQPFFDSAKDFTAELLGKTIDLLVSKDADEQVDNSVYNRTLAVIVYNDEVFNTQLLEQGLASFYPTDNSILKTNEWLNILQEAQQNRAGIWNAAGQLIFSELLPNPVGLDSEGEWVEIYNPTDVSVILTRFLLDNYSIPSGTSINPKSFLVLHRNQTGVTLGNSGDTINLSFPGGLVFNELTYDAPSEGQSWALIDGVWKLTSKLTPGEPNILEIPDAGGDDQGETEENIPINSSPINIQTGEFQNFENYLVTITGTVVETSGNTFYLDDGSGKAKVYIQSASNIDKPEMHRGDVFQVTGIVNLYRNSFRILPQKQDDIQLISTVKKDTEIKTSTAKKSSASTASAKKTTTSSNALARAPTSKQVASANDTQAKVNGAKSSWWVQMIKAIVGLAAILLLVFVIKLWRYRKENPQPQEFGDET